MRNLDYYDTLAGDYALFFHDLEANMEAEGSWLDDLLQREGAGSVLDACCGSGRQTVPLAQRGYEVTAADPCNGMLTEARRLSAAHRVQPAFHRAAFVDLPALLDRQFDAVLALGNGLCNQERREDIRSALSALRACCRQGGLCLIGIKDFDVIRRTRPRFHGPSIKDDGHERAVLFQIWDYDDPLLLCTACVVRGSGEMWSLRQAQTREYMLGSVELEAIAAELGFRSVERLEHPAEAVFALR